MFVLDDTNVWNCCIQPLNAVSSLFVLLVSLFVFGGSSVCVQLMQSDSNNKLTFCSVFCYSCIWLNGKPLYACSLGIVTVHLI